MSMAAALSAAMSGLRANQAAMAIVSSNVANAQTPGYISRSAIQSQVAETSSTSVRVEGVTRDLDIYLQNQLRTETSGSAYATRMSTGLSQLQNIYGAPGGNGTLETALSNFTSSLQSLSASSGSSAAQSAVLGAAKSLANALNATTSSIQALRTSAEQSLSNSTTSVNNALTQVATINGKLLGMSQTDPAAATLMDQRDTAINQLTQFMDVRVVTDTNNQAAVFTGSGLQLVSASIASSLVFDNHGQLNATALRNPDPTKSSVGTLMLQSPSGSKIDLTSGNLIASGSLAADLKLRDQTLVQAQAQVDQFAATLSQSLSDKTTPGVAATSGALTGFDLDTSAIQPGNGMTLTYSDTAGVTHTVNIVRVDAASALPLSNVGNAPNTVNVGVNFTGGMTSVVSQLNTALSGAGLAFSNTGATLRVLNTAAATATPTSASTTTTASGLASGDPRLALFSDGTSAYTSAITATGPQITGYAGRIGVNPAVLADPSKLTIYNTSPVTNAGDTTRSDFLYTQLTTATSAFSPATGLGSAITPFKSTLTGYLQQVLTIQSDAATSASQLQQGQSVVVSTLQSKLDSTSGVSIDNEMANLISLQNTYAANAHVMSVVQQMLTTLLQSV